VSGLDPILRWLPLGGWRASQLLPQARLAGPMPWVIAIMIALTVIAAAGGLALSNLAHAARAELDGGVTVQIVEAGATAREQQAKAAVSILSNMEGIARVRQVSEEELNRLVEPWLGETGTGNEAVPTPALIDVQLRGAVTDLRLKEIRTALKSQAPAAQVDAQASWLTPVFDAIHSLQYLALGLVLLLAATSAAAVWLAARSALGGNRETIEIVHLLGGTDAQIARIFQRSVGVDALMGGIAGLSLGIIAVMLLGRQFAALGSGMVSGGGLGLKDWLAIGAIPFVGVIIAMLTARLTVLAALRKIL